MRTTRDESDALPRRDPPGTRMLAELSGLSPAYFGMVMATGIVSLAAHLLAMPGMAHALFRLNIAVYAVLWVLTVLRMARYPQQFFGDMIDHARGPGFFTTVAGTSVLGSQFVLLAADYRAGTILWVIAILPPVFLSIGLAAWTAAFAGLALDLLRRVRALRN
jgi:tellurite resistance protein TehA-like permease